MDALNDIPLEERFPDIAEPLAKLRSVLERPDTPWEQIHALYQEIRSLTKNEALDRETETKYYLALVHEIVRLVHLHRETSDGAAKQEIAQSLVLLVEIQRDHPLVHKTIGLTGTTFLADLASASIIAFLATR